MRVLILVMSMVVILALAIISLAWGTTYYWPDFVHTNYGFPLVWGTHTSSTIIGPVDSWHINMGMLVIDLSFWFALVIASMTLAEILLRKR